MGIRSFTDLEAWKKAHAIALEIYKITDKFPSKEIFGLTNQIRRSAVSVSSNIAEGFSRNSYKDKMQFYYIALGSLTELQSQLLIAKDIKYLDRVEFDRLADLSIDASKLINGLIKKSKEIISDS